MLPNSGLCCIVLRALCDALRHFRLEHPEVVFIVLRRRFQYHGINKAEMPNVEGTQIKFEFTHAITQSLKVCLESKWPRVSSSDWVSHLFRCSVAGWTFTMKVTMQ